MLLTGLRGTLLASILCILLSHSNAKKRKKTTRIPFRILKTPDPILCFFNRPVVFVARCEVSFIQSLTVYLIIPALERLVKSQLSGSERPRSK